MNDTSGPPLLFDRRAVRRYRRRALAAGFPDFLNEAIGIETRRSARQEYCAISRRSLVHRAHPGSLLSKLSASTARLALRHQRCGRPHPHVDVVIDEEALPFAPHSLDCVIWVLGLEQFNDLPGTLIQIRRALRPDGLFLAAALAGDSFAELRASLIAAESELKGGAESRVLRPLSMFATGAHFCSGRALRSRSPTPIA